MVDVTDSCEFLHVDVLLDKSEGYGEQCSGESSLATCAFIQDR